MSTHHHIKKLSVSFFYLIVLYYLLPFSPIYLYYTAHEKNPSSFHNEKGYTLSYNETFLKTNFSFSKKDKNRFDVDSSIIVPSNANEFVFTYITAVFFSFQCDHSDTLTLSNSNRGPPSA